MSSMLFNPFWKTVLYCDSMIITGAFTLYGIRGRFALGECILLRDERCWVFLCWLGMMQKQLFESWDNQVTWMSLIWKHYLLLDLKTSQCIHQRQLRYINVWKLYLFIYCFIFPGERYREEPEFGLGCHKSILSHGLPSNRIPERCSEGTPICNLRDPCIHILLHFYQQNL